MSSIKSNYTRIKLMMDTKTKKGASRKTRKALFNATSSFLAFSFQGTG